MEDGVKLFAGGPYRVNEGEEVTLECTIKLLHGVPMDYAIGWQRIIMGKPYPSFTYAFHGNGQTILNQRKDAFAHVSSNIFEVSFNASVDDAGHYRCHYQRMPTLAYSNDTEIVVEGLFEFILALKALMMTTI